VEVGDAWLEIKSTAAGVLDPLGYRTPEPPEGAAAHEHIFSIVIDDPGKKTRALPSLHHGRTQVFVHRDLAALGARLNRALEVIGAASEDAAYFVASCRIGDKPGLYLRDLFNRSSYRLHLSRLGVEFAEDPYTRLMASGLFDCRDWGEFEPQFVIAGGPYPADENEVIDRGGGLAPFTFGILRVGQITSPEIAHLSALVRRVPVLASRSPQAVMRLLQN
jgi:hypothetical protein